MSVDRERIVELRRRVDAEWRENIAPFWSTHAVDETHGGFRGFVANDLTIDETAEKGVILNARILWTFSRAHVIYRDDAYLRIAERAFAYLVERFLDTENGGVYWTVDHTGAPADTKKRTYAQAFALYALSEFHMATGSVEAIDRAFELFEVIEDRCADHEHGGYFETFERDWTVAGDQRLSEVDMDEKKSMNAHLHVLEAYTTLARAQANSRVRERLRAVVDLFLAHVVAPSGAHLRMFFDERWASRSDVVSFGHDVEASWLLCEAAEVLGDAELTSRVRDVALRMAGAVLDAGIDGDGGLLYEADETGIIVDDKDWWPQTEAVVGFLNAYQLGGDERFLTAVLRAWEFVDRHVVDKTNGEWFWRVSRDGTPALDMPKVSLWKCPYHNGRMCFETIYRTSEILESHSHGTD